MNKKAPALRVLYEDNHLLVIVKPPMMPVQADRSGDMDVLSECKHYIKEQYDKPGAVYLGLVHRLDRPVGGVMVFARTSKAAARLQKQMEQGKWEKKYLAVIEGRTRESDILIDSLVKDETTHSSRIAVGNEKGKEARLSYQTLAHRDGLSLVEIDLDTGRHHQIRVQLASRGLPIWGDARYNAASKPGQPIALWANGLTFEHPVGNRPMHFMELPPCESRWDVFYDVLDAMKE